ncbi:MAG: efflux RND transporter periplasmic adaptor subunit [Phycisphaerales bacterium]|jgi:RND family efflux transporter MFP subunit
MPNTTLSRLRRAIPLATRVLAGLFLLIAATGLFQILKATRAEPTLSEDAGLPPLVRTVEVRRVETARPWTGYGTVRSMTAAQVAVQVAGRIVDRPDGIEAGLSVEAGDLILEIDPRDFRQRVTALEGTVTALEAQIDQLGVEAASLDEQITLVLEEAEIARREYERARGIFEDRGAGTPTEVDQKLAAYRRAAREASALQQQSRSIPARRASLEANITSQRAELDQAKQDLERATVTAPISGVLQDVSLDEGDYARVGDPAARIVDLGRLELPLSLPASAAGDIAIGDEVEVVLESGSDARWNGTITRLAPEADAQTRSIRVFVEVAQELETDERGMLTPSNGVILRPGMFVVGRVLPSRPVAHLLVPRRAVVQGGVLIADLNSPARARRVDVETLFALEGDIEGAPSGESLWFAVEADLQQGQQVLVTNLDDLRDGSPIRVGESGGAP